MLLWQAYENRVKFFITYILSNTRILNKSKRLAFFGVGKRWIITRVIYI
jgi:hypothetical protein